MMYSYIFIIDPMKIAIIIISVRYPQISGESDCDSTNDYHFDIELIKWFPLLSTEALLGKTSMKIVNIIQVLPLWSTIMYIGFIQRRVITNSGWRLNDDSEVDQKGKRGGGGQKRERDLELQKREGKGVKKIRWQTIDFNFLYNSCRQLILT